MKLWGNTYTVIIIVQNYPLLWVLQYVAAKAFRTRNGYFFIFSNGISCLTPKKNYLSPVTGKEKHEHWVKNSSIWQQVWLLWVLQEYDLFTRGSERKLCNSDQIAKGHPYSAETDEKNLREEFVDDMRTLSENRKAAAFFFTVKAQMKISPQNGCNNPFPPISSLLT